MSEEKKEIKSIFVPPGNPDERHKWISTWIDSIYKIYQEVINQTEKAQPEKDFKVFRLECEAARKELQEACEFKRQAEKFVKETDEEKDSFQLIKYLTGKGEG